MDGTKEALTNAETAFANNQYKQALLWYGKVLEEKPDDLYALSRSGAICVALGDFPGALEHFSKAKKLDPENGDNAFNYGNALFFQKDYGNALEQYVEAEKLGLSDDVRPRLYYQMAMLSSIRQDIPSALIYFKKCEQSDESGALSLNPDLISEKMKLYMLCQDYAAAEKCAAQLVAVQPGNFKWYMVCFSIYMAGRKYAVGEKLLEEAERYAEMTEEERFTLLLQRSNLYLSWAKAEPEKRQELAGRAAALLEARQREGGLQPFQLGQLLLALGETYLQNGETVKASDLLQSLLSRQSTPHAEPAAVEQAPLAPLTEEELEAQAQADLTRIQERIDSGELDEDMGDLVDTEYDEDGNLVHLYDPALFGMGAREARPEEALEDAEAPGLPALDEDQREKALFLLLSCRLEEENFPEAERLSEVLRHSENKYYQYYGLYTAALSRKKQHVDAQQAYAQAIAFFRARTFSDPKDTLASIFRARLYAEEGNYAKAEEIAQLLSEEDRGAILAYVSQCRAGEKRGEVG